MSCQRSDCQPFKKEGEAAMLEKHLRVTEFAERSRYATATVRKMILQRRLAYRKVGRLVLIPETELHRIMGAVRPAIEVGAPR